MRQIYVGVDVSQDWLDVFHPTGGARRIANDAAAVAAFAEAAARAGERVVFEATGGCDHVLLLALETKGATFSRINPRQARDFARARGVIGKTDRRDARLLADYGARLEPPATAPRSPALRELQAQIARRRQLVEIRKQERTRRLQTFDAFAREDIESHIAELSRRIKAFDARIAKLIAADADLAKTDRRLRTAPGVGAVVAATLIAEAPELGRIDRRAVAALVGLAPVACDSGKRSAPRAIAGGRGALRSLLYVAALQATRRDPAFAAFRERLKAKGKRTKVAIVAVARKLLVVLNAMLAANKDYSSAKPT